MRGIPVDPEKAEVRSQKISSSKLGEKNPNWKGDNVSKSALHQWIKRRLPKPSSCQICHLDKPLELCCIGHQYNRNVEDWFYLCRSCHSTTDLKIFNIDRRRKTKFCSCGTEIPSNRTYCKPCSRKRRLEWWREFNRKRRGPLIRDTPPESHPIQ